MLPREWRGEYGATWDAFVAGLYVQHGILWLVAFWLGCVRARPKTNFHTLCVSLLLTATTVKFVWLADPGGFQGVLSPAARSSTQLLPQILWFIVVMLFIAMWYVGWCRCCSAVCRHLYIALSSLSSREGRRDAAALCSHANARWRFASGAAARHITRGCMLGCLTLVHVQETSRRVEIPH